MCHTVKPVGEPDAGNPHVRFDERGGKRDDVRVATAPNPDSTENKGSYPFKPGIYMKTGNLVFSAESNPDSTFRQMLPS